MFQLFSPKRSSFHHQASVSRLLAYLRLLFRLNNSLEGASLSLRTTDVPGYPDPSMSELDQRLQTHPGALCELLGELLRHLRSSLPGDFGWLVEEAIEVVSDHPFDAGGTADILVGTMGDRKVAIKRYRLHSSSDYLPTYVRFYHEAFACSHFRNHSFVPFTGIYSTPEHPMCLVFEYMDHLNLKEYLRKNEHVGRRELLLEVARAVEHLHKADVVHKNIKITNILVDADGHAHVGGFGAAFLPLATPGMDVDKFFHGAAPELVGIQRFGSVGTEATKATDVYAFGVLAWEVFAGQVPFSDKAKVAAIFSMWMGRRPTRPSELSDRLWRVIEGCWKANPARRMTIAEVVVALEEE
ncbi:kinase-like protein [Thelephora ganbajun]|uniref:Kinase-like protein n=1 Tax=Thelephora ganbajun TaxID=370292 RepID=A0ACB6YXL9_THEGA|nr:kinase-like protein [Thelephora ganbajun]